MQNLFTVITVLNLGLAVAVIFLERRNVAATWAWLMVLFFLPVAGFLLYLILGQNLSKRKLYNINKESETMLAGLIDTQRFELRRGNIRFNDPSTVQYRDMIYMNLTSGSALFTQDNDVEIFTDGNEKFESLIRTIIQAERHVHLMYFIVRNDRLGNRLMRVLTEKAREGVQVRFLYDHIGSSSLDKSFFKNFIEAGGQAAAFFPSKIRYLNMRLNYRNHRKLVIVDGKYGYVGGFNVGDEYLGLSPRFGYWRDTHLRITGRAVHQMQMRFMSDWNLASTVMMEWDPSLFPAEDFIGNVGVQIISSGPNDPVEHIRNAYIKLIHSAKESIYIQTPYFIPDDSVLTALKMAVLSGVDVRLMIPKKPDYKLVYWASYSYLGELLRVGMKCYLYEKGFLHAKTIVVDGKAASVGTANIDIRSFRLDFEVNAVIYNTETAARLKSVFEADMADSRQLTYKDYQARPRIHKFRESCTRLLSPIL